MIASHTQALPNWKQLSCIAIYLATDEEADPQSLGQLALQQGKRLFLPVIQPNQTLLFAPWQPGDTLISNRFGIAEPAEHIERVAVSAIELVCMPLVGWSDNGARLGMGGGYYDRTLSDAPGAIRLGLGYDCQQSNKIPCEDWDVHMQWVVTESGLHPCSSAGPALNPG